MLIDEMLTAARTIAARMDIAFPSDGGVTSFGNSALDEIEHVVHELAHAILLGLPLSGGVSTAVTVEIDSLGYVGGNNNEALCFVVEREVLRELGYLDVVKRETLDAVLEDALEMQIADCETSWDLFHSPESAEREDCADAIIRIPGIFQTYMEKS